MSMRVQRCTGCGQNIHPAENGVHFSCPSCGDFVIWRCEKCRRFAHPYKCVKCNYQGP